MLIETLKCPGTTGGGITIVPGNGVDGGDSTDNGGISDADLQNGGISGGSIGGISGGQNGGITVGGSDGGSIGGIGPDFDATSGNFLSLVLSLGVKYIVNLLKFHTDIPSRGG